MTSLPSPSPPPQRQGGWRLSWKELAQRTGATAERLRYLAEIGVLEPRGGDLPVRSSDILRVRAVAALEASGVALDEVAKALAEGQLSFGYLDYVAQPPPVVEQTHVELCAELGVAWDALERFYLAFGLPQPHPDEQVREDDAAVQRGLKILLESIDEADVLQSARLFGDALRPVAEHLMHLFHTRVEERFRQAGIPEPLVLEESLREVGVYTSPLGEQWASWLYRRHSESFTVEHRVLHGEEDLERAGIRRRGPVDLPAIVFLDISGYTRMTEELGDEAATAMPMRLAVLVQEAASRHGGRTLKWIGDGVELYFRRPIDGPVLARALRACRRRTSRPPTSGSMRDRSCTKAAISTAERST
jgi:adenylate cyclase